MRVKVDIKEGFHLVQMLCEKDHFAEVIPRGKCDLADCMRMMATSPRFPHLLGFGFELPVNRMEVPGGNVCMPQKGNVGLDKLPFVSLWHLGVNDPGKLESIILMSPENRKRPPVNSL